MNALDRCDRCGAQAVVSAYSLDWVTGLLFCHHRYREHAPELTRLGVVVVDEAGDPVPA